MADRTYIIELLLKARDETARAFAEATGNMEAYDKLLVEQKAKTEAARVAQTRYTQEFEKGTHPLAQRKRALSDLTKESDKYNVKQAETARRMLAVEEAQRRVTKAQVEGQGGTAKYAVLVDQLLQRERALSEQLQKGEKLSQQRATSQAHAVAQRVAGEERVQIAIKETARLENQRQREIERVSARATAPAHVLASPRSNAVQEAQAERELLAVRDQLKRLNVAEVEADNVLNETRTRALHTQGFATQADRNAAQATLAKISAMQKEDRELRTIAQAREAYRRGAKDVTVTNTATGVEQKASEFTDIGDKIDRTQNQVKTGLGNIASSGSVLLAALQPAVVLIGGLVGAFTALASAAVAAGSAVSVSFVAGIAEGIPVMGVFAAAAQRLTQVMGYVTAVYGQAQQKFLAAYQTQYQNKLGINQIAIAQHNYADTLYAASQGAFQLRIAEHSLSDVIYQGTQAIFNERVAQLGLLETRQQATRQLQDLINAETNAKLAAEGASLSVADAQKALAQAVATGGDVQQAQLQLAQAQAGHTQAVQQAHRSITDAARGSLARQQIGLQVQEAQNSVQQAQRAVVDSRYAIAEARQAVVQAQRSIVDQQFAVAQARAAVIQAQQTAAGFNVATAAQLAWLRSQMTTTEKSLANNILGIYKMFQGVHGRLRPVTDAILGAFIPLTKQIHNLFMNPQIFAGLMDIARHIGAAVRQVTQTVFSPQSLHAFTTILHDAAKNIGPFTTIIVGLFKTIQRIVVLVNPFLHQFLQFLGHIVTQFAQWVQTPAGSNWIRDWFREAFKALEAFVKLGLAFANFIGAVVSAGGAKTGISLIQDLTNWLNKSAAAIKNHTGAFYTLQQLWSSAKPVLSAIATILGAVIKGIAQISGSSQGQSILRDIANLFANVLVPAVVTFTRIFGPVLKILTSAITWGPIEFIAKYFLAGLFAARAFLGVIQLFAKPLIIVLELAKNLRNFFLSIYNTVGKVVGLLTRGKFGFGSSGGQTLPEQIQASLETGGKTAAGVISNAMTTAGEKVAATIREAMGTGGGEAASEIKTAEAEGGGTAATEIETAEVAGGGTAAAEIGGAEVAGGAGAGAGGLGAGLLARAGAVLPIAVPAAFAIGGYEILSGNLPGQRGTTSDKKLTPNQLLFGGGLPTGMFRPGHDPKLSDAQKKLADAYAGTFSNLPFGQQSVAGALASAGTRQLPTIISNLGHFPHGDVQGGVQAYLSKWLQSAQSVSVINSSSKALNALRERAIALSRVKNIADPMRTSLIDFAASIDPVNVAIKKAGALWAQTFTNLGITVPHVVNKIKDQLNQDQKTISSNFTKGTQGWTVNMIGLVQSAVNRLKPLAAEGVKGAKQELDKLTGQLTQLYGHFQSQFNKINDFISRNASRLTRGPLLGIAKAIEGGARVVAGAVGGRIGGPVGSGYGGGDTVPYMLEPGEHILTKEEVQGAGGHGAVFALRRTLGGGGQSRGRGFATGGAITNQPVNPQLVNTSGGQRTQGVTGYLGDALRNIIQFEKQFVLDWHNMWASIYTGTKSNIQIQENLFANFLTNLNNTWNKIQNNIADAWKNINQNSSNSAKALVNNLGGALNSVVQDINKAFSYVQGATNASLKAFQAKPVHINLGTIPKFAEGGIVGAMGERGRDVIPALLGRGEAVLNYAHQKVVDPALRAFYGWRGGLTEMFDRVRGTHSEASGAYPLVSSDSKYGGGGYVFPFGGSGWSWSRTDQGVDFGGTSPVGAIGPARVTYSNPNDGWYPPAPAFMVYQLTGGPDKGKYIYVAEHITNMAPAGTKVPAGQAVAEMVGGIEMGWAAGPQGHQIVLPMGANHLTAAGEDFHNFLIGLTHGQIVGGKYGGGAAAAMWKKIKDLAVSGAGPMHDLVHDVIHKVVSAANKFGENKAGGATGAGVQGVKALPGGWFRVGATLDPTQGQAPTYSDRGGFSFAELLVAGANAGLRGADIAATLGAPNGQYGLPMETPLWARMPGSSKMFKMWKNDVGSGQTGNPFYKVDLHQAIANALGWIPNQAIEIKRAFARGGVVGDALVGEGKPVSIIAHAGEWVLNKLQQSKLSSLLGTSTDKLKEFLGFTGGPTHFQGGGEAHVRTDTTLPYGTVPTDAVQHGVAGVPVQFLPTVQKSGSFTIPSVTVDLPDFWSRVIKTFLGQAHEIVNRIETSGKGITKGIAAFVKDLNQITGDNGLFAQAAQAVSDYVTVLQTNLTLATSGIRVVNNQLRTGVIPTTLGAARLSIDSLRKQGSALGTLHQQDERGLSAINKQIAEIRKGGITKKERADYTALLGARTFMINQLNQVDQSIGQNYQDRFNARTQAFQSRIDQLMRTGRGSPRFTLSGLDTKALAELDRGDSLRQVARNLNIPIKKLRDQLRNVGPGIAAGFAQTAQTIAQTLGDPRREVAADKAVSDAANAQRDTLRAAYARAAAKAKHDPRWQQVADQLLGQLQSAQTAAAQAQAQELQDRISKIDVRAQVQAAANDMRNRIATALVGLGRLSPTAGFRRQIQVSEVNTRQLEHQVNRYTGLLAIARREGNAQEVRDLTAKIDGLRASIDEAKLATQQLRTQLRQTALTAVTNAAQASSGFYQTAQTITQTLGQVAGGLQNIPQLIRLTQQQGRALSGQAGQVTGQVRQAMSGRAFGAFQNQADALLGPLQRAFAQGPQAFATELAQLGPSLAALESKMPADVSQLFQGLIQAMSDNSTSVAQNTAQQQQLAAQLQQTALALITNAAQTTSGFFQGASSIIQTLGQITGSLNLPQLIQIAHETATALTNTASQLVGRIQNAMATSGNNAAFGAFQGQANALLSPLMAAFQQGPQQFAMLLAQLGPQIAALEASMGPDAATTFQQFVQSMIDNTTATVQNNQQLQQLNATSNQQSFTSSAWTNFRQAIFTGLGGLLPQYAMQVPTMDTGGFLTSSGLLYGHAGETIVPANVNRGELPVGSNNENHFHFEQPMEVADPVYLGSAIAWKLAHDPNTR